MYTSVNTVRVAGLRPVTGDVRPERLRVPAVVPRVAPVAVVLNARAKRVTRRLRSRLASLVPERDLFYSTSLEEAAGVAATLLDRRYARVLLGGGDGTVAAMLGLLMEVAERATRGFGPFPEVGILRLGTGNGLACLAGAGAVAHDVARAVSGDPVSTRVLRLVRDPVSGAVFPFASLGYDAQVLNDYIDVVERQRSGIGRRMAKSLSGYLYAIGTRTIPAELNPRRPRIRVVSTGRASAIDPETHEEIPLPAGSTLYEGPARAVAAGTTPFYGFGLKVLPDALKRQDRFQVRVCTAPVGYLLTHLPSLWSGALRTHMRDFLVEGASIDSSEPLPMQMAGDARGKTCRLELRLVDRAFRLIEGTGTSRA